MLKDILKNLDISSIAALVMRNWAKGAMDSLDGLKNIDYRHCWTLLLCSVWDSFRENCIDGFVAKVSRDLLRAIINQHQVIGIMNQFIPDD